MSNKLRMRMQKKSQRLPMMYSSSMDVAEVYSPPRITKKAEELGMKAGWALDLTCMDEDDGKPWDFNDEKKRRKAVA